MYIRKNRRLWGVFCSLFLAGILTGCGGGDSSNSPVNSSAGNLAGTYTGTWTDSRSPAHNGTLILTVLSNSITTGSITDSTAGTSYPFSTSVLDSQGQVNLQAQVSSTITNIYRGPLTSSSGVVTWEVQNATTGWIQTNTLSKAP